MSEQLQMALAGFEDLSVDPGRRAKEYNAMQVLARDPERYEAAVRALFEFRMSGRAICRMLGMHPYTLAAIEARELDLHPERVADLQRRAKIGLAQVQSAGVEALRGLFFDNEAVASAGVVGVAKALSILHDIDVGVCYDRNAGAGRSADSVIDYDDVTGDGFGAEKRDGDGFVDSGDGGAGAVGGGEDGEGGSDSVADSLLVSSSSTDLQGLSTVVGNSVDNSSRYSCDDEGGAVRALEASGSDPAGGEDDGARGAPVPGTRAGGGVPARARPGEK